MQSDLIPHALLVFLQFLFCKKTKMCHPHGSRNAPDILLYLPGAEKKSGVLLFPCVQNIKLIYFFILIVDIVKIQEIRDLHLLNRPEKFSLYGPRLSGQVIESLLLNKLPIMLFMDSKSLEHLYMWYWARLSNFSASSGISI